MIHEQALQTEKGNFINEEECNINMDRKVCNPKNIKNLSDLDNVLENLDLYRSAYGLNEEDEVGVGLLQNRQFGGTYKIVSKYQVKESKKNKSEWYVEYYPLSYFKDLRKKLT